MRRFRAMLAAALVAVMVATVPVSAAPGSQADSSAARPTVDRSVALVQLKGDPLATAAKTKPAKGKKIDFTSASVRAYRAELSARRNAFKKWLATNAPKARLTGSWDISLNAVTVKLNGASLTTIRKAPQVARAEYGGLYYPTAEDPDLALIDAVAAWGAGGAAGAGRGVKVAIVDSGIDIDHPCFSDAGYPAQTQLGDRRFTNNKVIAARVFYDKARNQGLTAEAVDDHGTHVAGTVACNHETPAEVSGVTIPYAPSGVAPAALLGNYNVFPGTVESARSEDILNALDAAYADGMDVANMSLGGSASGIQDLLTIAVDNLDRANMVVAVSNGNEGPGHFTVGSPGSAARALTAGASSVGHYVAAPVTVDGASYGAVAGDFPVVEGAPLVAPLGVVTSPPVDSVNGLSVACSALPAGSLAGKIALIGRGACDFSTKIRHAELAGAVAVLVANRAGGDPTAMGEGASPDGVQPTVPAYMISLADSQVVKTKNGLSTTISPDLAYFLSGNDDVQASFTSEGPTDVDFRVKPDLMAPGVNVLSSVSGDCGALGCWAFFSGTSMASPHLAGAAAVVRGRHPTWTAEQVRSAIVNTAETGVVTSGAGAVVTDVNIVGSGRLDLDAAVVASAALAPVSVSYGAIPSGSGQTRTASVAITNLSAGTVTWSLGIADTVGAGVSFATSPSSVSLAPGASTTVKVTMTAAKGAARGDHQAVLTVAAGGTTVAHAVVYAFVK
ncbi:MAG: S8 family serine peptidase [Candidatus Limnocylindria bacterium]